MPAMAHMGIALEHTAFRLTSVLDTQSALRIPAVHAQTCTGAVAWHSVCDTNTKKSSLPLSTQRTAASPYSYNITWDCPLVAERQLCLSTSNAVYASKR